MVGTFVTPYLAKRHELRVLDVRPPEHADLVEYVEGSIANPDDLARALDGMDTFVDMVMRARRPNRRPRTSPATTRSTPWAFTSCCGLPTRWGSRPGSTSAPGPSTTCR